MSTEGPRRPFSPHPDWFAAPETTGEFPVVSDAPAPAPPSTDEPFAALDAGSPAPPPAAAIDAAPPAEAHPAIGPAGASAADALSPSDASPLAGPAEDAVSVSYADADADAAPDAAPDADDAAAPDADADAVAAAASAAATVTATATATVTPPTLSPLHPAPLHRHLSLAARPPDPDAPPETRPALLVATAASILPPILLYWFWLKRARFSLERAIAGTLSSADDDPLLLLALFQLFLLTAFTAAWLVRDAGRRRFVPYGRWLWAALLFPLGPLALTAYLAARPDLPKSPRR